MYCKECGAEIEEGKFCKECKWKLEVKQDNSFTKIHNNEEIQSNKRVNVGWILLALLLPPIGLIGGLYYSNKKYDGAQIVVFISLLSIFLGLIFSLYKYLV
jgi:uncharacterized membrane protein YvbJ